MIELQDQINYHSIEQINADRFRKSTRLLNQIKPKRKISIQHTDLSSSCLAIERRAFQNWSWKPNRFTELMKLLKKPEKQQKHRDQKQLQLAQSLELKQTKSIDLNNHFRGRWKAPLQSEILIAPCKQLKLPGRIRTETAAHHRQCQQIKQQLNKKARGCSVNSFKLNLKNSIQRKKNRYSKVTLIKHLLKIEEISNPKQLIQQKRGVRQNITLEPLPSHHQKNKQYSPSHSKSISPQQKNLIVERVSRAKLNILKRISKKQNKMKKTQLSAWTFHNQQQNI